MNHWRFRCFHCEGDLAIAKHGFCSCCVRLLKAEPYCGRCGAKLPEWQRSCGQCLRNPPKWHAIVQISAYKPPLADWISRFKLHDQYWLDLALARLLLLAVKNAQRQQGLNLPEVIFPTPLFWQRQWHRGYNQAELLARPLSKWLKIPVDYQSLSRIRATRSQKELSAAARRKNLQGAFCYQPLKNYQRVAILDDVVTTGSTMNVICAELLKKGVQEIQVWTLARV